MQRLLIFILFLTGLTACNNPAQFSDELPVARVYDVYLFPSELASEIPDHVKPEDSISLAKNYIDKWLKKQLKLKKAEEHLSDEIQDINEEIENYRTGLLIYKYEQYPVTSR